MFERNLAELLTRAYEPVAMRPEFRSALRTRVAAQVANGHSARLLSAGSSSASLSPASAPAPATATERPAPINPAPEKTPGFFAGLAAAAVWLLVLASGLRVISEDAPTPRHLVAQNQGAVRLGSGPWRPWDVSRGPLVWRFGRMELQAPLEAPLEVISLAGDRVELQSAARGVLARADMDGPAFLLDRGSARVHKAHLSPQWTLEAPELAARMQLERGEVELHLGPASPGAEGSLAVALARGAAVLGDGRSLAGPARARFAAGGWDAEPAGGSGDVIALADAGGLDDSARVALDVEPNDGTALTATGGDPGAEGTAQLAGERAEPSAAGPQPNVRPGTSILRGQVASMDSSVALDEFRVWVREEVDLPKVSEPAAWTSNGTGGAFELNELAAGSYTVFVEAKGHAAWRSVHTILGSEPVEVKVVLERGAGIRGFVVDEDSDLPIAGVLVLADFDIPHQVVDMHGFAPNPMPFAHARTDANGAFVLRHLSVGPQTLRISHRDFAPTWVRLSTLGEGALETVGSVQLGRGGSVVGRAERPDGTPFAGAEVIASRIDLDMASSTMSFGYGIVDESGQYRIDGVAPGHYVVMNLTEQPNERPDWTRLHQTWVDSGEEARVDFLSATRAPGLAGQLVDVRGEPVSGWFLTLAAGLRTDGFTDWSVTPSAADGRFEFIGVTPGPNQLYLGRETNSLLMRCATVQAPESGVDTVRIELADTEIRGRLVDRRSGEPLLGGVFLQRWEQTRGTWSFMGRGYWDGGPEFRFVYVPVGRYRILGVGVATMADVASEPFDVRAGTPVELDVPLDPGGSLVFEVSDGFGQPLEGARIRLTSASAASHQASELKERERYREDQFTGRGGVLRVENLPLAPLVARVALRGNEQPDAEQKLEVTPTVEGTLVRVQLDVGER